ncbi:MAG TPA: XrtA/PEP-CTERM system TPR-repeat protein PrsT [Gammaproteobacteria bacterium]
MLTRYLLPLLCLFVLGLPASLPAEDDATVFSRYEQANGLYHQKAFPEAIIHLKNILQIAPEHLPAHVLLGKCYLETGDGAGAEKQFLRARKLGADPVLVTVPLARALMMQHEYQKVVEEFPPVAYPVSTRLDLHLLRGQAYLELSHLDLADKEFVAARDLDSARPEPLVGLATILLRRNELEEAEPLARQARERAPENPEVWYLAGAIEHARGRSWQALEQYARALELEPRHLAVRIARAGVYMDLGQLDKSREDLDFLREEYPRDPRAAYLQGVVLARGGDEEGAHEALSEAAAILDDVPRELLYQHTPSLLLGGLVNYSLNRNEQAITLLQIYVQQIPGQVGARKLLGSLLVRDDELEKAVQVLEPALAMAPEDEALLTMLGSVQARLGRHGKAAELLGRALDLNPLSSEARLQQATLDLVRGRQDAAMTGLAGIFEQGQENEQAGIMLGVLYLQNGELEQGLEVAQRLVARDPGNETLQTLHATALTANGQLEAARGIYLAMLSRDADFLPARLNLAKLDRAQGRPDAARAALEALLQQHPRHVEAMVEMARLAEGLEDLEGALRWLRKAHDLEPDSAYVGAYLSDLLLRSDRAEDALKVAHRVLRDDPDNQRMLERQGLAELGLAQTLAARVSFKKLSQLAGFDAPRLLRVARLQVDAEDLDGAAWSLQKAVNVAPDSLRARVMMAEIELARGKLKQAEDLALAIQEQWPDAGEGYYLLGMRHVREGEPDKAAEQFRRALARAPSMEIALQLASTYRQSGRVQEAIDYLSRWERDYPGQVPVRLALAEAHLQKGDLAAAAAGYEDLLASQGEDPRVLNNLAYIALRQDRFEEALALARRAHALDPGNPYVNDTLGWSLVRMERAEEGLRFLREAQLRISDHPEIRYHLGAALAAMGRDAEARTELRQALAGGQAFEGRAQAKALLERLGP